MEHNTVAAGLKLQVNGNGKLQGRTMVVFLVFVKQETRANMLRPLA